MSGRKLLSVLCTGLLVKCSFRAAFVVALTIIINLIAALNNFFALNLLIKFRVQQKASYSARGLYCPQRCITAVFAYSVLGFRSEAITRCTHTMLPCSFASVQL